MSAITIETAEMLEIAKTNPAAVASERDVRIARAVKHYTDQDPTLFPEAVAHILTPNRRRTATKRASETP